MRGLRWRAAGAVLASVLVLSGCASTPQGIDEGTAQTLDNAVVAVAEKASADDYQGALTELARLQAALDSALAAGSVSSDRAQTVQVQVDVVRSDLEALIAGAAEPTPVETTSPTPEESTPVEEEPEDTPSSVGPEDDLVPSPDESEPEETPTEPAEPTQGTSSAPSSDTPGTGGNAPGNGGTTGLPRGTAGTAGTPPGTAGTPRETAGMLPETAGTAGGTTGTLEGIAAMLGGTAVTPPEPVAAADPRLPRREHHGRGIHVCAASGGGALPGSTSGLPRSPRGYPGRR